LEAVAVAELVRRPVTVIVATGGDQSVQAAKAATATIPIVATIAVDPVESGLVVSMNRPGVNLFSNAPVAKRAENASRYRLDHRLSRKPEQPERESRR
jgi:putative ABC transport system substrate-binding protein